MTKEHMSETLKPPQIEPNFEIDMESIRQLGNLAKEIKNVNKLVIPSDVEIMGKIHVRNENNQDIIINGLNTQQNQELSIIKNNQNKIIMALNETNSNINQIISKLITFLNKS